VAESFILYTGFIVFFESIWALFLTIFRAEQKPGKYIFASSLQVVIVAAVTIVFVAGMGEKAEGIFKGRLIGDIVVSGILLWSHRKQFSSAYSWNRIRELLAYGLPYLPAGLAIIWINLSGRYFLHRYSTLDEVGIYAIAQKLSGLVNLLIIQPFGAAWFPIMFEVEKSNDAPLLYSRMTTYYVFCAAFSFLMFTLLMPEIFSILTSERYNNGTRVFPILMLAFLIYGLFYTLAIGIFLKSQNWVMPYIYGAGIIINVILNVTLIHQDGARGAALAMLLTFFVVSGCQGFIAQRFYPIPFEFNRLGKIILVGGTLLWVGHFFMNLGTSYLILRMGLIALFPIVLYGMGFYTQLEIRKALEFSRLARVQGTLIAKSMLRMKKTIRDER
jgi:O-antigen/teichoic acid export membrane protein